MNITEKSNKELVSEEYKKILNNEIKTRGFGDSAILLKFKYFIPWMEKIKVTDVLDYGSGSGFFKKYKGNDFNVIEYDPGRDDISKLPDPCEFILCLDVLEHVEPELIDNVLDDLQRVIIKNAFISIALNKALRILPDGRNAHILLKDGKWWLQAFHKRFKIYKYNYGVGIHDNVVQCINLYISSKNYHEDDGQYI